MSTGRTFGERPNKRIRRLDDVVIDRIAAGEVIERPASAIKELVENALDAGAQKIDIHYARGGKGFIRVIDDGFGIAGDELALALTRHATSKLDASDLLDISTYGFRGEALPSMGAAGRLTITSRRTGADNAFAMTATASELSGMRPAALGQGTVVELADLFAHTPARLKFLRSDVAEARAISDVVRDFALAEPSVEFNLLEQIRNGETKVKLAFPADRNDFDKAVLDRLDRAVGGDFAQSAIAIQAEGGGAEVKGYCTLPTFTRGNANAQFLFVNRRPVKDRLLRGALRAAYADVIARGRHPVAAIYVTCDSHDVDVNVHPAKVEVRFRRPAELRSLLISAVRNAIASHGHVSSPQLGELMSDAFRPSSFESHRPVRRSRPASADVQQASEQSLSFGELPPWAEGQPAADQASYPLGVARAQLHQTYIVAQTEDGMILVDQHAAHERLVYEDLKAQLANRKCDSQQMLVPAVVELSDAECERLLAMAEGLKSLGLAVESFGKGSVLVRAVPALLAGADCGLLLRDILDGLDTLGEKGILEERLNAVISRMSCHGSIRAGRSLTVEEMNALLRQMENCPLSGQCNHGRPTYVELKRNDIEKLFGRG